MAANIEEIARLGIELSMESSNFSKQMTTINKVIKDSEKEFNKAKKEIDNFENTFTGLSKTIDKNKKQIDLYNEKLGKQKEEFEKLEKEYDKAKSKLNELEQTQGKSSNAWKEQAQVVQKYGDKLVSLNSQITTSEKAIEKLTLEIKDAEEAFEKLGTTSESFESKLAQVKEEAEKNQKAFDELSRELDGSLQGFQRMQNELNNLANKISTTRQSIDLYKTELNNLKSDLGENQNKHRELEYQIQKTSNELAIAKSEFGENSQEVQQLGNKLNGLKDDYLRVGNEIKSTEQKINQFNSELKDSEHKLKSYGEEIKKLPFEHMQKELQETKDKFEGFDEKVGGISGKLKGVGAVGVVAFVQVDEAVAKVKAQLGLTDKQAEELKNTAQELSKKGFDFGDAIESITLTERHLSKLPGALSTKEFSEKIMSISKMFDVDISEVVRATGQVMQHFEVDGTKALDGIVWGFQNGLDISGEWLDTLTEYSTQFDIMGLSFDDTLAILKRGMDEGAWSIDQLADGVKEFKIRLLEIGDAQKDALGSLNISVGDVKKAFNGTAQEGQQMAFKIAMELMKVDDEVKRNELSVALFGTKYEDVGDSVVKALGGVSEEHVNLDGKVQETQNTFENTFGAKLKGKLAELQQPLADIGEALIPIIEHLIGIIGKFAEWFGGLDEGTQQTIVMFGLMYAMIAPVLSGVGSLMGMMSLLGLKMGDTGGKASGLGGKLSGLGESANILSKGGLYAVVLALWKIIDSVGDSEQAILYLQEKFGGIGVAISGLCEFISGVWDLTMGNLWLGIKLVFDLVAALIDGPGGLTVKDAWNNFNNDMNQLNEDAISKLYLSTTRGTSQLLNANETHLNNVKGAYERIMPLIPEIVGGNYQKASTDMSHWLSSMTSEELTILQGMNDQTKFMFGNITKNMSTEEVKNQLISNFEKMKSMGLLNTDELQKGVTEAMGSVDNQLKTKTKTGTDEATKNFNNADKNINNAVKNIENTTNNGMGNTNNNMQREATTMYKGVTTSFNNMETKTKQHATNMMKGVNTSTHNMSQESRQDASTMHNGVRDSASAMAQKAKQSASDMYRGVTNSTNKMANEAIRDWNRIRNTYSVPIRGTVTKTTINRVENRVESRAIKQDPQPRLLNETINAMVRTPNLNMEYNLRGKYFASEFSPDKQVINLREDRGTQEIKELKNVMLKLVEALTNNNNDKESGDTIIYNMLDSKLISKKIVDPIDRKLGQKKAIQSKFKGGSNNVR